MEDEKEREDEEELLVLLSLENGNQMLYRMPFLTQCRQNLKGNCSENVSL